MPGRPRNTRSAKRSGSSNDRAENAARRLYEGHDHVALEDMLTCRPCHQVNATLGARGKSWQDRIEPDEYAMVDAAARLFPAEFAEWRAAFTDRQRQAHGDA